jgi:hypothetical protein
LQGLYRCRVEDIQKLEIKTAMDDGQQQVHSPVINRLVDQEEH